MEILTWDLVREERKEERKKERTEERKKEGRKEEEEEEENENRANKLISLVPSPSCLAACYISLSEKQRDPPSRKMLF